MFDPRKLFLAIWGTQVVGFLFVRGEFFPIAPETWLAFAVGFMGFYVGTGLAQVLRPSTRGQRAVVADDGATVRAFFRLSLLLYFAGCAYAIRNIMDVVGADTLASGDFPALRNAVVMDFLGDRVLFSSIRVFYFGVGLAVFALAHATYFRRAELIVLFVVGVVSAIATTGRLYLLLYILATAYLLHRQKVVSKRAVGMIFAGFLFLFFLVALAFDKGGGETESVGGQLVWNIQVYFMSSLACFNNYVTTGSQETYGGILIPNVLRPLLAMIDLPLPEKPDLLPFAMVPMQCNTYTILFPLFHDLGYAGVFTGLAGIGFAHGMLWLQQRVSDSRTIQFAYAISLYPLAMSMFEDAYFSSPGFWVMLWIPPICLHLFRRAARGLSRLRTALLPPIPAIRSRQPLPRKP